MISPDTTEKLAEALEQAVATGDRVILRRGQKVVGAVISPQDLARLEEIEDRLDVEESERRLADTTQPSVPLAEVRKKLGLL